jgi:hypothetical protein
LRESAEDAIRRVRAGEHRLAYDARSGARSLIVELCAPLVAGAVALVASLWLVPWLAIALGIAIAAILRGFAGHFATAIQRWWLVSTELVNAVVTRVDVLASEHRRHAHAVVSLRAADDTHFGLP